MKNFLLLSALIVSAAVAQTVTIPSQTITITIPAQTVPVTPGPVVPIPPAVGTAYGYVNGIYYWAGDFSYSAKINYADTNGNIPGKDISVTLTGAWGAWQPYMASNFSYPTKGFTKLTFQLKPTVANQQWSVFFVGVGDVPLPPSCGLNVLSYGPAPKVGVWATYTVPLSALCVLNQNVYKFDIQDKTGLASNLWYVNNVGFAP